MFIKTYQGVIVFKKSETLRGRSREERGREGERERGRDREREKEEGRRLRALVRETRLRGCVVGCLLAGERA